MLMKKKGLSLKMPENELEDREAARMAAKALTQKRLDTTIDARLGVLLDSTSGDQKKVVKIIKKLKQVGYDVKVIFIETSLETAQKRNQQRSRTIPPDVVKYSWSGAQEAKKFLKRSVAPRDYHVIENEFDGKVDISLAGKLSTWAVKIPVKGQEWVAAVKRGQDSMTTESINNSIRSFYRFWSKQ